MSKTQNITISNQSSKIFIYNAPSPESIEDNPKKNIKEASSNQNTSLITIQFSTPETPEYHIRINNSFKEKQHTKEEKDMMCNSVKLQQHQSPKNETPRKNKSFELDEDVLMEGTDGKFYLGTIISSKSEDYLIRFDDNTEKWSSSCKLKKLTASPTKNGEDSSLCVICKISKQFDVVEICDKCSRGYHRQCIKEQSVHPSQWNCCGGRCSFDVISISDSEELDLDIAHDEEEKPIISAALKLPYDVSRA